MKYHKPSIEVANISTATIICSSNEVSSIGGNSNINYGGGGSGPARTRRGDFGWEE